MQSEESSSFSNEVLLLAEQLPRHYTATSSYKHYKTQRKIIHTCHVCVSLFEDLALPPVRKTTQYSALTKCLGSGCQASTLKGIVLNSSQGLAASKALKSPLSVEVRNTY